MMERSWMLGLALALAACGDDGKTGTDTTTPDATTTTDATTGDTTADATEPGDTSADATEPGDTSADATTPGDTSADATTPGDTSDTSEPGDTTPPTLVYDPIPGHWSQDFAFSLPGLEAAIGARAYDMVADPTTGDVVVGGIFDRIGALEVANVARWSATDGWSAMGDGLPLNVQTLTRGEGGDVYAGGRAQSGGFGFGGPGPISKWDGTAWSPIGWTDEFAPVWASAWVGGELVVGGEFTAVQTADQTDSVEASYLARWDGSAWHAYENGPDGPVYAIAVHDGELCVGGLFANPGSNVACLGPSGWHALGDGLDSQVNVLYSEAPGKLMAGGYFDFGDPAGPPEQFMVGLGRYDSAAPADGWKPVAGGVMDGAITTVWEIAPAGGNALWIGGCFKGVNAAAPVAVSNLARLDGTKWTAIGGVTNEVGVSLDSEVGVRSVVPSLAAGVGDDSLDILIGGLFSTVTPPDSDPVTALNVARHSPDSGWTALVSVSGPNLGVPGTVNSLSYGPDGDLYIGGYFTSAGGVTTPNVARLGTAQSIIPHNPPPPVWQSLGDGLDGTVWVVHAAQNGKVYAGGSFFGAFGRFDGTTWDFPGALDGDVHAIAADDAGGGADLYLGGDFTHEDQASLNYVARFTGATFQPLGKGLNARVNALLVAPDGSVYAGGFFGGTSDYDEEVGTGLALPHLARWNGASWEDVGGGVDGYVSDLAWWHDDLIVVGQFQHAGTAVVSSIARWDGDAWSPIGTGTEWNYDFPAAIPMGHVTVQDNGFFVTGAFADKVVGTDTFTGVAWWNGTSFEPLGTGLSDLAEDVAITPDGRAAFIGGPFLQAGGQPSMGIARWEFDDAVGTPVTK
ncbi:MAG: hypothetical protein U1F43_33180 [Myxococcota bacterium]